MPRYNHATIEPKWQQYWEQNRTFAAPRMPTGEKMYVLDMFPYPSGDGLHVGHPEGYTATDIVCRYQRMRGKAVMHPMGFDSFGLPAEEHAIRTNTPPRISTEKNIENFRRQLKMLGFSFDWQRELATTDPDYFRWTQFIFLVLFDTWFDEDFQWQDSAGHTHNGKGRPISELPIPAEVKGAGAEAVRRYQDSHRLAYQHEAPVNWCPALGTVLANEEVVGGVSEVGGHPVVRLPLRQWMLHITAYADRLEKDLELVDWPASIKKLQSDWIGRSTGAEVDFYVGNAEGRKQKAENEQKSESRDREGVEAAFEDWKSHRAKAGFPPQAPGDVLRIYTTRPDTLFGATYMVIAPEHPFVNRLAMPTQADAVQKYCEAAARKSDLDRTELSKEKTGVFTGSYAINPVNGHPVPIWVADYVLISYGTGAIMAVPAHDERDFEFAKAYHLPIVPVVKPTGQKEAVADGSEMKEAFIGDGEAINSGHYNYLSTPEFKLRIIADLAAAGLGIGAVNYKLRDWLFSRQRFWGEPFPILHELDDAGYPTGLLRIVPASELPVNLPELADFKPIGEPKPPLEKAPAEWLYPVIDGKKYKRETNTMPQWAGSCWYYLRFLDNKNGKALIDPAVEKAWMPVDLYIGGAEHAVLHLLYSRFWHKVLFDRGYVSTQEPFMKLVNQGMILGEPTFDVYVKLDDNSNYTNEFVSAGQAEYGVGYGMKTIARDQVTLRSGVPYWVHDGKEYELTSRAEKMSKSRGNVVNPDQVVKEYGADSLRLYEMFMGPLEATKPWSMAGVNGVFGFLGRVWRMIVADQAEEMQLNPAVQNVPPTHEQNRTLHKTIAAVTKDLDHLEFNTAIARMMEFTNFFTKETVRPQEAMEKLVLILSPFAPHIAEELWQALGHTKTLAYEPWPTVDPRWLQEDTVEVPVQINGKLRGKITVPAGAAASDPKLLEAAAKADPKIAELLAGKTIIKVVAVPGRLVNFVIKG
ncbi:MAG TPA: leucine--tRNA ligase [Pirellulales bacterium]|nr:leucine--tRNA ligase [Pirellulales bacterium]